MIGTRDKTLEKSSRWHKGKEILRETDCRSGGISGNSDTTIVDKAV